LDPFKVRLAEGRSIPTELNVGTKVTIKISDRTDSDNFKISVTPQKTKYDLLPIYTGKTVELRLGGPPAGPKKEWSFILDQSGTTYQIKVTLLGSPPEKDKDKDIFTENLQTLARYYFGSHIGIFLPFGKSSEYSLGYATSDAAALTIMENKLRYVSMVFIGSIYPFGFEPEGKCDYRRIQVNLATELSSSIFKKIYFGLGYDFTYFSISFLGRLATVQELQGGFQVTDSVPSGLKSVPTVSRNKFDLGVTFCMPMDLIIGWLGRSLGLK